MESPTPFLPDSQPEYTGRYLVLAKEDAKESSVKSACKNASLNVVSSKEVNLNEASVNEILDANDGIYFEDLKVAVVNSEPQQVNMLAGDADARSPFLTYEPERVVYALTDIAEEYLTGYRDAIDMLLKRRNGNGNGNGHSRVNELIRPDFNAGPVLAPPVRATWGLQATNVINSSLSGKGVNVAVLDTGFFHKHLDFKGRNVTSRSFISEETAEDGHGHGTHCIGTALGPRRPKRGPRYGVAYQANIFAGKVLSNAGWGTDSSILAGIEWAVQHKCRIISMSLGGTPGPTYSRVYEEVANRVLSSGTIIIAAAGNDSRRPGSVKPVSHPANCPSIMAVGAIGDKLDIAYFSCGSIYLEGGGVDIAAPGVDVYSAWLPPSLYRSIQGTSMATPHVAGIAALYAEAYPKASGQELWFHLVSNARRMQLPSADVGSGLVYINQ
jgi:subtilisin family serine protease